MFENLDILKYPLVEASSSLSDIVITETAGDGVS